ncbi:hypothetical protein Tco_0673721 [Tanacetum coccineum]
MEMKDTLSSCSNSEEQRMQQIQDKAKRSCMVSFRILHSHLKLLSNNDLKGTRTERGFKRAFAKLFPQDDQTFIGTMFLNVDQLEKQLDKKEFQEIGSMSAFRVLETQFHKFIKSQFSLDDDDGLMARKYFLAYTQTEVQQFRDTLIQHMESVKKSVDERALHKREYDNRVNERQIQTTERTVDTSEALDANIRPIYDEDPMADVQLTVKYVIKAINIELEHKVDKLLKENETLKKHYKDLYDSIKTTRAKSIEQTTSLIVQNAEFKTQLQEKGYSFKSEEGKNQGVDKRNLIPGRQWLHGIALIHEISARPKSQEIRCSLTSQF